MLERLPEPAFMPCPDCGASVARNGEEEHVCDRDRWLEYQLFAHREEIERLEFGIRAYFDSPEGRFQVWDAERRREAEHPDQADDDAPEP
jgi:hypothetical protein